jgi:hypothetical protein
VSTNVRPVVYVSMPDGESFQVPVSTPPKRDSSSGQEAELLRLAADLQTPAATRTSAARASGVVSVAGATPSASVTRKSVKPAPVSREAQGSDTSASATRKTDITAPATRAAVEAASSRECTSISLEEWSLPHLSRPSGKAEVLGSQPLGRKLDPRAVPVTDTSRGEVLSALPPRDPGSMPTDAWQALSSAASGLTQILSFLYGQGNASGQAVPSLPLPLQVAASLPLPLQAATALPLPLQAATAHPLPLHAAAALPLPPQAVIPPVGTSSRPVPWAPSTSSGVSGLHGQGVPVSHTSRDSSAEEDGNDFEVLSSSSVEERDDEQKLAWPDVVAAIQAFHPDAVVKADTSSLGRRSWAIPTASVSGQLVESPLILEETEKVLSKLRNCDFDGSRLDAASLPDFPAAQKLGSFVGCPKRKGLLRAPVKLGLLAKDRLRASRHDLALAGRVEVMPKEISVPTKAMASILELVSRSLELTSVLDSLSLALGKVCSGTVPESPMSSEQALPLLLQAVDQVAQSLASSLSGAYVNSLLTQRDALLKLSTLPTAFKSSLRAVPISSHSLFGPCAKLAVEEAAKRTTDEAFAAIARQGKRSQPAQSAPWPSKKPKTSGSSSGFRNFQPSRTYSNSRGRGRGSRGNARGAFSKRQSKGAHPQ